MCPAPDPTYMTTRSESDTYTGGAYTDIDDVATMQSCPP